MSFIILNKEISYQGSNFNAEIHIEYNTSLIKSIVLRDANSLFLNTIVFDSTLYNNIQYMRDYKKAIIAVIEDYKENASSSYRNDLFYEIENWDGRL